MLTAGNPGDGGAEGLARPVLLQPLPDLALKLEFTNQDAFSRLPTLPLSPAMDCGLLGSLWGGVLIPRMANLVGEQLFPPSSL